MAEYLEGFTVRSTGGGCEGLSRVFEHQGHQIEVLVTDELSAPDSFDDPLTDIVVSVDVDGIPQVWADGIRGRAMVYAAISECLLGACGGDVDYALSEIWPDWTDYVDEAIAEDCITVKRYDDAEA